MITVLSVGLVWAGLAILGLVAACQGLRARLDDQAILIDKLTEGLKLASKGLANNTESLAIIAQRW